MANLVLSEAQAARLQTHMESLRSKASNKLAHAAKLTKQGELKRTGEAVGAAALIGALRGYMEKNNRPFTVPGFEQIDLELVAGLGLVGAAYMDAFGKYDEDALNAGNGILAHYVGQMTRNSVKSGTFSAVGGGAAEIVGGAMNALTQSI